MKETENYTKIRNDEFIIKESKIIEKHAQTAIYHIIQKTKIKFIVAISVGDFLKEGLKDHI